MGIDETFGLESAIDYNTDPLPTGIPPLDHALGGGVGRGRFTELFGTWSSGKSLILALLLAVNQKVGGKGLMGDTEGSFDGEFFRTLGGDPDKLRMIPDKYATTVEGMFGFISDLADMVLKEPEWLSVPILVGWDGIANCATKHLMKEGMDKRDMSKALSMSQGMQLITNKIKNTRIAVVATNQTRDTIGSYDSATHTPGGTSYKFGCSQRVEFVYDGGSKGSLILHEEEKEKFEIGRRVVAHVRKNKMASPFGQCRLFCYTIPGFPHPVYERKTRVGIDAEQTLFDYYLHGRFFINDMERVVSHDGAGWYSIHPEYATGEAKFREKDFPEKLEKFPVLKTILYEVLEIDPDTYLPKARKATPAPKKRKAKLE